MPKIIDFEKKQQEIVDKALNVFIERGYHNTNLAHIAKACGMGRTTLYQYFKNKDEIFIYVANHLFEALENDCKSIIENCDLSFFEKISKIISLLALQCQIERNKMLMMVEMWLLSKRENPKLVNKIEERITVLRQIFEVLLRKGIKAKEFKDMNTKAMAFTISTLVESFVLQASFAKDIPYQEHLINIYMLLDGLQA